MADTDIREGFLCPMCKQDLGSIAQLQQHFDEAHPNEDKDVLDQLKGLFGKAKRRLLRKDKEEESFAAFSGGEMAGASRLSGEVGVSVGGIDPAMWAPQELGATKMYTDEFRRLRDARIDRFVVETNKLVIRLDKLVSNDAPTEPSKRKAFEKSVVPWDADADISVCISCLKQFTLTRRRHHCRLCGGIMCNKCSQFLPFSYAKKLTNPSFSYEGEGFRRSSSNSSLNSMLSPEGELHIRTCGQCRNLLERRDQQMEQRNSKPLLAQLYEKMKTYMEECDKLLPDFLQMADSLGAGETTYSIHETQRLRVRIMKLYETIDSLSKRIMTLGMQDAEPPPPKVLLLQRKIRSCASSFLQENMLGLQNLPSEEDLVQLQQGRKLQAQRRIEQERREAAERDQRQRDEALRIQSRKSPPKQASPTKAAEDTAVRAGWKPMEVNQSGSNTEDPMIQQMNIIRGYIKQARQAQRWDEVQMLEENLKELQKEYWNQTPHSNQIHSSPAHSDFS